MIHVPCRCGVIELELSGEPLWQFFCHCADCQAVFGGAYVGVVLYPESTVRVTAGVPKEWKLKRMPRMSCSECGTRLFAEPPGLGFRGVAAAILPKGVFSPEFHIHCKDALRPVVDELPHYAGLPVQFGGSNDVVDR